MKRLAIAAMICAVCGYVLVGGLSYVPAWPLTLIEHFRVQYMFGGIAVAVAAFVLRSRWFDVALVAWLVALLQVVPDLGASANTRDGTHVRVVFSNVLASNTRYDDVVALIRDTQPDIVALVETRAPWFEKVAPALEGYQRIEHDRPDNFGLGLYAKGTVNGRIEHFGGEVPTIVAAVEVRGVKMTFIVTHPWPPTEPEFAIAQMKHLSELAQYVRTLHAPLVIAGDLNATPWSRQYRKLVGTTGLCDSRAGFGYQGSYPAGSLLERIPIDHVLISCDVGVHERRIGPDVGSDHLPVIVDLRF